MIKLKFFGCSLGSIDHRREEALVDVEAHTLSQECVVPIEVLIDSRSLYGVLWELVVRQSTREGQIPEDRMALKELELLTCS